MTILAEVKTFLFSYTVVIKANEGKLIKKGPVKMSNLVQYWEKINAKVNSLNNNAGNSCAKAQVIYLYPLDSFNRIYLNPLISPDIEITETFLISLIKKYTLKKIEDLFDILLAPIPELFKLDPVVNQKKVTEAQNHLQKEGDKEQINSLKSPLSFNPILSSDTRTKEDKVVA